MVSREILVFTLILLASSAWLGSYAFESNPGGKTRSHTSQTSNSSASCAGTCTTLEPIISGQFQSSIDKSGTGGTVVTVKGLTVLYVHAEADGDWHVAVTDGRVQVFITEIIPRDQTREGQPAPGAVIDETGTPFCDTFHQTEAWHGSTCWEIHPVTGWVLSS